MIAVVIIILGVVAIRMGTEAIRTKLIRYRKSPTDGHRNPLYSENLTGQAAVRAGWICIVLGVVLTVAGCVLSWAWAVGTITWFQQSG